MKLPDAIPADDVRSFDIETDVVILGFGAAGACAALEARRGGAEVVVCDRASGGGGTTNLATGHFYLGGGTRPQRANGIEDSPDAMFRYLMENTPFPEEEKIRLYADESVQHFEWLVTQGVPFNDGFWRTKHVEQPTDECLIWSGNEKLWPIIDRARPAPRGHKVEKEGSGGGSIVVERLESKAREEGVRFEYDTGAKNLIVDSDGAVVGVRYKRFDETGHIRARRGVVLATGGFIMNDEMLSEFCPTLADERITKQGNPFDDGSGILLGMSIGGEALYLDRPFVTSPFYPPENLIKGILVNREGKRFVPEDAYHARSSIACLEQPGSVAYLVCDNEIFDRPDFGMQQLVDAFESIEEMETRLGMPSGALQETVSRYNENAARGEDPDQHKHPDWLKPLDQGPFAALDMSLGQATYMGFTLGGLRVSIDAEVQRGDGTVVPGLYAAGACASNIAQDAAGYSSGTCIGEATFFGRRGGRHAADRRVAGPREAAQP